jgi:hypothetical protein
MMKTNHLNTKIRELGKQYGLGTVLTFSLSKSDDKPIHDILLAFRLKPASTMKIECVTPATTSRKYSDWPEVINTLKIADMCDVKWILVKTSSLHLKLQIKKHTMFKTIM